ncbi:GNAT family N-acetyltransferase [Nocardiopsis ganjiahuensis]|uniref:GNAT family N-acetyltransferase n=1 Tax=Nocardiopsis ganjiahuensis TaxID=239984 RepID=UPI0003491F52|nr:GNAT family N-acetyltransferase [Nocardiopsis ganjiahuensis]
MDISIRACAPQDHEAVVALALRAWEPVHASMAKVMGAEIYALTVGDWRLTQARDVRADLDAEEVRAWVAVTDRIAGFATVRLDHGERVGELHMLAVDPDQQERGVGSALIEAAEGFMREEGMRVALVSTGGDPGHAPARVAYESAGYTAMPAVNYFKAL